MVFFINGWQNLLRILFIGITAYAVLVFLLRISKKRTLSKMNAFDFVITISLGSVLGTSLLQPTIGILEILLSLALLIFLQFIVTWTAVRWPYFERIIKSEPALVFHKGEFLNKQMKKERITKNEIIENIRESGLAGISEVESVILEANGNLSVIGNESQENTIYENVVTK